MADKDIKVQIIGGNDATSRFDVSGHNDEIDPYWAGHIDQVIPRINRLIECYTCVKECQKSGNKVPREWIINSKYLEHRAKSEELLQNILISDYIESIKVYSVLLSELHTNDCTEFILTYE